MIRYAFNRYTANGTFFILVALIAGAVLVSTQAPVNAGDAGLAPELAEANQQELKLLLDRFDKDMQTNLFLDNEQWLDRELNQIKELRISPSQLKIFDDPGNKQEVPGTGGPQAPMGVPPIQPPINVGGGLRGGYFGHVPANWFDRSDAIVWLDNQITELDRKIKDQYGADSEYFTVMKKIDNSKLFSLKGRFEARIDFVAELLKEAE